MFINFFNINFFKSIDFIYKSNNLSIIYNLITIPIMQFIVELLPKNLPPNIITLTGFLFMIFNLFCIYNLNKNEILNIKKYNPLINIISSICLFFYWLLDNLDGHQARRTKSGSPLGLFTDHGIDSFNNSIICIAFYISTNINNSIILIYLLILFNMAFFLTTLDNKLSGIFNLWYFSFPDEGLILLIIFHILLINKKCRNLFKKLFTEKLFIFLFIFIGLFLIIPILKNINLNSILEIIYFILISILGFLIFKKYNDFYIYSFTCSSFTMSLLVSFICKEYKLFPLGFLSSLILLFLYFKDVNSSFLFYFRIFSMIEMFLFFGISVNRFEKALNICFYLINSNKND